MTAVNVGVYSLFDISINTINHRDKYVIISEEPWNETIYPLRIYF